MRYIDYNYEENGKVLEEYHETVYNSSDCRYPEVSSIYSCRGYNRGRKLIDVFATLDIETTTINVDGKYIAYMYLWQVCLGSKTDKIVVMGRRWEDFANFIANLTSVYSLDENRNMVFYIHYLPYEYQFIKQFVPFQNIFAKSERKPLKCNSNCFEFRCSQALSNMSLAKFIRYTNNSKYYKLDGDDFDYTKRRTPDTYLSDKEVGYGYNDVRGLHDSICKLLEDDDLSSIPLTSTGYVRRDMRTALKRNPNNRALFLKTRLSKKDYIMCKQAFRGGDTHASRFASGVAILEYVFCVDIQSAYPWAMLTQYFPVSAFLELKIHSMEELNRYCEKYCCLFYLELYNLHVKPDCTSSYIPVSKTLAKLNVLQDNGRIIYADYIKICVTEIDYEIIQDCYTAENVVVSDFRYAIRGEMPKEKKETILKYYMEKTELKHSDPYLYGKSKNKLNGCYGMDATDIVREEYYTDGKAWYSKEPDIQAALDKYYDGKNNFNVYQNAVWVTAHVRKLLHRGRKLLDFPLYWDTDSLKYIGKHPKRLFKELNNEIAKESIAKGAYYDASDGRRYILGIFSIEEPYRAFKTLGAKKYVYNDLNGKLHCTVAGISKEKGAKRIGTIDGFRLGRVLKDVGRTVAYYNEDKLHTMTVDGSTFLTGSNIALVDSTYEIGVTDEYLEVIRKFLAFSIDINPENL